MTQALTNPQHRPHHQDPRHVTRDHHHDCQHRELEHHEEDQLREEDEDVVGPDVILKKQTWKITTLTP